MTMSLFFKVSLIWLVIAGLAIGNGAVREYVLVPIFGEGLALPISGISLSIIVFIITWISFPFFGKHDRLSYVYIGLQWVVMTLIFEFAFGHYVAGKSWPSIIEVFDVMQGNLFVLVLLTSLASPLLVAKLKNTFQ